MKITLYDPETNEERETFVSSYVPWRLLKKAVKLSKSLIDLDVNGLIEEDMDVITSLVVELFGNQFTIKELDDGAERGEMLTVLHAIIAKAGMINKPSSGGEGIGSTFFPEEDLDWLVELEISLVKTFGWSLYDIDQTDIDSLLPFINQMNSKATQKRKHVSYSSKIYCDDPKASWL